MENRGGVSKPVDERDGEVKVEDTEEFAEWVEKPEEEDDDNDEEEEEEDARRVGSINAFQRDADLFELGGATSRRVFWFVNNVNLLGKCMSTYLIVGPLPSP